MKEKLIIKNFGPIKVVELKLSKFNVLIGDQGTGKSTVAKLLIAIGNTCYREIFDLKEDENFDKPTNQFFGHLKNVGIYSYLSDNTEIFFENSKYKFTYLNQIAIPELKTNDFLKLISYDFTYIPAERNIAIALLDSLYALIEIKASIPSLLLRFGNKFQTARKNPNQLNYKEIIGVNYQFKDNVDIIILTSGKEIRIRESSSGIQGLVALLTVFNYVVLEESKKAGNLLVIEEPELDCFPKTQYKLVKHFINSTNDYIEDDYKDQLLITTHSPYILTSLNNLMYAYQVGQKHHQDVNKIINKKYWVNPNYVSAYQLLANGTCENIIDEDGLIMAEKIDVISREINKEFDLMQDIKLGIESINN